MPSYFKRDSYNPLLFLFQQGYYADPDTECQAFHVCTADGQGGLSKNSFLCPNGTIFNQNYFICDWWFNFDCSEASGMLFVECDLKLRLIIFISVNVPQ